MKKPLIYLDPQSQVSLQGQLRQRLVNSIADGTYPGGSRLPSSRELAEQLHVARNTVVLAISQLVDEGLLVSRPRSGIYVNEKVVEGRVGFEGAAAPRKTKVARWRRRFKSTPGGSERFRCPPDWRRYPYPFIDGQFDSTLYPVAQWREAGRMALAGRPSGDIGGDEGLADDPMLVEEIRTKMLPRRGISARADEILITIGGQNALYLLVQLLVDGTTTVALEDPGSPAMRKLLMRAGARVVHQPVDEHGLVVDGRLDECQMVYVTPSHQNPTAATMPGGRRRELLQRARARNFLVVEDDCESESNYLGHPHPALRGMDGDDCVVYVSGLPRVLAPGLEIGFMVASSDIIREARRLRQLMIGRPPMNLQRTAAYFLSLGHYDACMLRLNRVFHERWLALRDALNYLCKPVVTIPNQGGTVFWVRGPAQLDVGFLANEAANRGILIEPVADYCAAATDYQHCFRMGVSSIPADRIRAGVAELAALIGELTSGDIDLLDPSDPDLLRRDRLQQVMAGATFTYNTVYGDPCTIVLHHDGRMTGRAGHADEERDQGRWWIEDDLWCRQWDEWAYAEQMCFQVVVRDRQIRWFNRNGLLANSAVIRLAGDH